MGKLKYGLRSAPARNSPHFFPRRTAEIDCFERRSEVRILSDHLSRSWHVGFAPQPLLKLALVRDGEPSFLAYRHARTGPALSRGSRQSQEARDRRPTLQQAGVLRFGGLGFSIRWRHSCDISLSEHPIIPAVHAARFSPISVTRSTSLFSPRFRNTPLRLCCSLHAI